MSDFRMTLANDIPTISQLAGMIISETANDPAMRFPVRRTQGPVETTYGYRADGTQKGGGYFGELPAGSGEVAKEAGKSPFATPEDRLRVNPPAKKVKGLPTDDYAQSINRAIASIESGGVRNPYTAESKTSSAKGKYQHMPVTLEQLGYMDASGKWTGKRGLNSWEDYKSNPAAQEAIQNENLQDIERRITAVGLLSMVGQQIETQSGTMTVTLPGLIAASHNAGVEGVRQWLIHGGKEPIDGNKTPASKFMAAGNATVSQ